jgi:signal transduction histidine kinase
VEDDGGGFDVKKASDVKGSGLTNVRYRVNYLNGNINITSNPGHGTSINIELKI